MSFLLSPKKVKDGFHVVILLRDTSIELSLLVVAGKKYSLVSKAALAHRITPENGFMSKEVSSFEKLLDEAFENLYKATRIKIGNAKIKISGSSVVLFYPWFNIEERNEIEVGKKGEVVHLSAKLIEETLNNISTSPSLEKGSPVAEYTYKRTIVETFVHSISLNGYEVPEPLGKKSKNILLGVTICTAAAGMLAILDKKTEYHTGSVAPVYTLPKLAAVYSDLRALRTPALFIDIERENTTICSAGATALTHRSKFTSIGVDDILKMIMKKTGVTKDIALSYMRLSNENLVTEDISSAVSNAIKEVMPLWESSVNNAVSQINSDFPSKVILCCESELDNKFQKPGYKLLSVEKMVFDSVLNSV